MRALPLRHLRVAAAVIVLSATVGLAACTGPATSATSSSSAAPSAHLVHLVDVDGKPLPGTTGRGWGDDVFASPVESDTTFSHPLSVPSGAASAATFISPRGGEWTTSRWDASGWLGIATDGVLLPNVKISGLTTAGSGDPSGTEAVARRGGDYSLGIAFLDAGGRVIEADFASVTLAPADNPSDATWTWVAPAS